VYRFVYAAGLDRSRRSVSLAPGKKKKEYTTLKSAGEGDEVV
jgi:hypothetical protein